MEGEIFEICWYKMTRKALEFSTMVGEFFEICWHKMTRKAPKISTMVGENLEYSGIKWLENHLNFPPWLEKFLKYAGIKWLEKHLKYSPWKEGEIFEIFWHKMTRKPLEFSTMIGKIFEICLINWWTFLKIGIFARFGINCIHNVDVSAQKCRK